MRKFSGLILTLALIVAGCGGSGMSSSTTSSSPVQTVAGTMTLVIPNPSPPQARERQAISPAAMSVRVSVPGQPDQIINLTSSNCTTTPAGRTCVLNVNLPLGTPTVTITMYDGLNGTGNILGTQMQTITVTPSGFQNNTVTINGNIASIVVNATGTFILGQASSGKVTVTASDASGNVINGPGNYNNPINLTSSDSNFTLSSAQVTAPGQSVTLSYSGGTTTGSTINASSTGVTAITPAKVTVSAPTPTPSPTPSPTPTVSPTPSPSPTPTTTPVPTPTPTLGPVSLNPSSMFFQTFRQTMTSQAMQGGNASNTFSVSGMSCSSGANFSISVSGGTITVTNLNTSAAYCYFYIKGLGNGCGSTADLYVNFGNSSSDDDLRRTAGKRPAWC
ncbi:MAG: hypothetical protein JO347_10260 [Candidatus Eremiobacteraeota bacterium]|nr:hypothetical protein [Candidatus Eremiobacteraeota bacterium]